MKIFWAQLQSVLDKKIKKQLPYLVFIFILSSLLDVIGLSLIGFFLALFMDPTSVINKTSGELKKQLLTIDHLTLINVVGISIIVAFIIKAMIGIYSQRLIARSITQLNVRLKNKLVSGYQQANYLLHIKQNSGSLLNKVLQVDRAGNLISNLLNILSYLLIIFSICVFLVFSHPICTAGLAVLFLLVYLANDLFVKKKAKKIGASLATAGGKINKGIQQSLFGLKEIRILHREQFFLDRMKEPIQEFSSATADNNSLQAVSRYTLESGFAIFLIAFLMGAIWFGKNTNTIIPMLGIFAAASLRLLPTINQFINTLNQIRVTTASLNIVSAELKEVEQYHQPFLAEKTDQQLDFSVMRLHNIHFSYPSSTKNILTNINFSIRKGEAIGLIGTTGSGKSTLINIILGILQPNSGELLVNENPVSNLRHWMNNFAYIPQQIFLLDDSLKNNIAMGVHEQDISLEKLQKAIDMAQLNAVLDDLPQGIDTIVGENGVRLSGGQRQRVALARAFYHERDVIVMDEATSALDNQTEQEVIRAIKALYGIKTLIIIAHRLSTIQHCDRVYQLEKGVIVKEGTYDEVVK